MEHNLTQDSSSPAKYAPPPAPSATLTEKVTWLEEQVYGKAVADRPMFDRVRRLNHSVLPNDYLEFDGSIPENVNTLISAVSLDQVDRLSDKTDPILGDVDTSRCRQPFPAALPRLDPSPTLNPTATALQNFGMPSR